MSPTREQQAVRAGRPLGSTALVPSALAFSGAPLGGLYETVSDDEAERAVKRALELGLRYLDTAPHYGLGVSEWREVEQNAGAFNTAVPFQVWEEPRASGLLTGDVPVPDEPPSR